MKTSSMRPGRWVFPSGRSFLKSPCRPAFGIAGGAVLAFARGLGEFGATSMIAGNILGKTRTLPLAVYSAVAAGDFDTAGKYVIVIVLLSFLAVVLLNYLRSGKTKQKGEKVMSLQVDIKRTGKIQPGRTL